MLHDPYLDPIRAVQITPKHFRAPNQRGVALDFPAFDGGDVGAEDPDVAEEEPQAWHSGQRPTHFAPLHPHSAQRCDGRVGRGRGRGTVGIAQDWIEGGRGD